jgi:TetR/AcrR family transcriptional regulator, transcriptional repressor for nem operon
VNREEFLMAIKSTRDHLIDTGLELMHRHGYNATGLIEILKAADVPKGSFHHHFGSKEDFAPPALERYTARGGALRGVADRVRRCNFIH